MYNFQNGCIHHAASPISEEKYGLLLCFYQIRGRIKPKKAHRSKVNLKYLFLTTTTTTTTTSSSSCVSSFLVEKSDKCDQSESKLESKHSKKDIVVQNETAKECSASNQVKSKSGFSESDAKINSKNNLKSKPFNIVKPLDKSKSSFNVRSIISDNSTDNLTIKIKTNDIKKSSPKVLNSPKSPNSVKNSPEMEVNFHSSVTDKGVTIVRAVNRNGLLDTVHTSSSPTALFTTGPHSASKGALPTSHTVNNKASSNVPVTNFSSQSTTSIKLSKPEAVKSDTLEKVESSNLLSVPEAKPLKGFYLETFGNDVNQKFNSNLESSKPSSSFSLKPKSVSKVTSSSTSSTVTSADSMTTITPFTTPLMPKEEKTKYDKVEICPVSSVKRISSGHEKMTSKTVMSLMNNPITTIANKTTSPNDISSINNINSIANINIVTNLTNINSLPSKSVISSSKSERNHSSETVDEDNSCLKMKDTSQSTDKSDTKCTVQKSTLSGSEKQDEKSTGLKAFESDQKEKKNFLDTVLNKARSKSYSPSLSRDSFGALDLSSANKRLKESPLDHHFNTFAFNSKSIADKILEKARPNLGFNFLSPLSKYPPYTDPRLVVYKPPCLNPKRSLSQSIASLSGSRNFYHPSHHKSN